MRVSNFYSIVFTGGPCAGKTTILSIAKQYLESYGLRVVVLSEAPTELINAGLPPWCEWKDSLRFQVHLLRYVIAREDRYRAMMNDLSTEKPTVLLCDRGALDGMAYVGRSNFLKVIEECGYSLQELRERYKAVFHLVSAALGAEEFYTLDNNAARIESLDLARGIDRRTLDAWLGHPHHDVVGNEEGGFEKKKFRALQSLTRVLGMPEALEKERKFVVLNFHPSMIPENAVCVEIEQTYLVTTEGGPQRRVRKWTVDGVTTYFETHKVDTGEKGVRKESEEIITLSVYEERLLEQDPNKKPIRKKRWCFYVANQKCELDVFERIPLVLLEREVQNMDDKLVHPPGMELEEVTGDPAYDNSVLASR